MKIRDLILSTFFLLMIAGNVDTASFDCDKATSQVEKIICSDDELSKLDESLNKAYLQALEQTPFKEQTIRNQKQWLKKKRDVCRNLPCLKKAYEARINELEFLSSYVTIYYFHYRGVVNLSPFEPLLEPFKAILAMYALQAGGDCRGVQVASDDPQETNLECALISSLGLGPQCSKEQVSLIRKWFKDEIPRMGGHPERAYKKIQEPRRLESICYNFPEGATWQKVWSTISVGIRGDLVFVDAMFSWQASADGPSGYTGYSTVYRIAKDRIIIMSHKKVLDKKDANELNDSGADD